MDQKIKLSAEFESTLEQWAIENLKAIGVFKDKTPDFDKWKVKAIDSLRSAYSDKTIDLFLSPVDRRKMDSPDSFARITGSNGDTMEICIKVDGGKIIDSCFQTTGCKPCVASGGMVAEMVKGKTIDEVKKITPQDVLDLLGGLSEENEHYAVLAIDTLKEALVDLQGHSKIKE